MPLQKTLHLICARKFLYLWFRMTPLYGGVFPFCRNQRSLAGFSTVIIGRKTRFPFLSYPISLGFAYHQIHFCQASRHAIQGIFNTLTLLLRRRRGVKNGKFQIQEILCTFCRFSFVVVSRHHQTHWSMRCKGYVFMFYSTKRRI